MRRHTRDLVWLVVVLVTAAWGFHHFRVSSEPDGQAQQHQYPAAAPTEASSQVSGPLASPERLYQAFLQRGHAEFEHQNPKAALDYAAKAEALVSWTRDGESRHLEGLAHYAMGDWQGATVCLGEACISKVGPRAKLHYNLVVRRHPSDDTSYYDDVPNLPACPPGCPVCYPHKPASKGSKAQK